MATETNGNLVLALAVFACAPNTHPQQATTALESLRNEYVEAYDRGDASAMREIYADSAVRMPYDSPLEQGRDSVIAATISSFATRKFQPTLQLDAVDAVIQGNVAVERGTYHEIQAFQNGRRFREDGKYVFVAVEDGGRWLYLWSIFNRDSPSRIALP